MEYLTAKQIIGKLKQGRVTDISEAYFSQLVKTGFIPAHTMPGKKRKLYLYEEVKEMLDSMKDPSREPQRAANTRKREEISLKKKREQWDELEEYYMDALKLFSITLEELEELTGCKGKRLEPYKRLLFSEQLQNNDRLFIFKEVKDSLNIIDIPVDIWLELQLAVFQPIIYELVTHHEFIEEIIPLVKSEYE